jgi:hypothetical protein
MRLARPMSRRLLGAVALHGLVDIVNLDALCAYPVILALPNRLAVPAFSVASIVHFSQDIGVLGSILFHLFLLLMPSELALATLDVYFTVIHIPLLACRVPTPTMLLLFFSLAIGVLMPSVVCRGLIRDGVLILGPNVLKIVATHCLFS